MIELPESYVLASQINNTLVGKTIKRATANASPHKFAWYSSNPADYNDILKGKKSTSSTPGTRYTCGGNVEILCEDVLLILTTSIKYPAVGEKLPLKHQLWLEFEDKSSMTCTVQMWGLIFCYPTNEARIPKDYKVKKAPTPLETGFDRAYFDSLLAGVKNTISAKVFLATQQRIPGFGNGVLHDVLFNAKIHPKTKLENLSDTDFDNMYNSVKQTLNDMVAQGGRDTEKDLFGCSGKYKTIL